MKPMAAILDWPPDSHCGIATCHARTYRRERFQQAFFVGKGKMMITNDVYLDIEH
jgi:hypothetical protein